MGAKLSEVYKKVVGKKAVVLITQDAFQRVLLHSLDSFFAAHPEALKGLDPDMRRC